MCSTSETRPFPRDWKGILVQDQMFTKPIGLKIKEQEVRVKEEIVDERVVGRSDSF